MALDWTPNTNHTGFFVAKAKGCECAEGLKLPLSGGFSFCSPPQSQARTSARKTPMGSLALVAHIAGYEEAGLQVSLISPHADEYKATPLSRVADKTATFAITPSVRKEAPRHRCCMCPLSQSVAGVCRPAATNSPCLCSSAE